MIILNCSNVLTLQCKFQVVRFDYRWYGSCLLGNTIITLWIDKPIGNCSIIVENDKNTK